MTRDDPKKRLKSSSTLTERLDRVRSSHGTLSRLGKRSLKTMNRDRIELKLKYVKRRAKEDMRHMEDRILRQEERMAEICQSLMTQVSKGIEINEKYQSLIAKGTETRSGSLEILWNLDIKGNSQADIINFCEGWLIICKDNVSFTDRYESFTIKIQGEGFGGWFDSIFYQVVKARGKRDCDSLDEAIKKFIHQIRPTAKTRSELVRDAWFDPKKECGHQFYMRFYQLQGDALDRPEYTKEEQRKMLSYSGFNLYSRVTKSLEGAAGFQDSLRSFVFRYDILDSKDSNRTETVGDILKTVFPTKPHVERSYRIS